MAEVANTSLDNHRANFRVEERNNTSNHTNDFPLHHDGTTDIFRTGLIIYGVLMVLLACYHLIKCWKTKELSLFKNPISRFAQNNNTLQIPTIQNSNLSLNEDAGIEMHSILKISGDPRGRMNPIDLPPAYDEIAASTMQHGIAKK